MTRGRGEVTEQHDHRWQEHSFVHDTAPYETKTRHCVDCGLLQRSSMFDPNEWRDVRVMGDEELRGRAVEY